MASKNNNVNNSDGVQPSRRFALVDVPDPESLSVGFVYNFFTPDERTNSSGDTRVQGAGGYRTSVLRSAGTFNTEVSRFVELSWTPGKVVSFGNFGNAADGGVSREDIRGSMITGESEMTTDSFLSYSESDPDVKMRSKGKMEALSRVLGLTLNDSNQTQILSQVTGIPKSNLQPLVAPTQSQLIVNFAESAKERDLYDAASDLTLSAQINMRTISSTFGGSDDISPLSGVPEAEGILALAQSYLKGANTDLSQSDLELSIRPSSFSNVSKNDEKIGLKGVSHVGYLLKKSQMGVDGRKLLVSEQFIRGTDNTKFIDTKIIYGSKYTYSVKNVYRIDALMQFKEDRGLVNKRDVSFLVKSKSSAKRTVETVEFSAPNPPDGVFHSYNYTKGRGLLLTWQFPTGRSRDVKYFQIFKRRSIFEPFQCIGEIDFDNSMMKTERPERVRQDLTIKNRGAQTYFEDSFFNRDSRPVIYAVCAVDAHGLTSTYSAQTQVSFNKDKNIIELKNISRPGAPKQYPNFFIDPDLDENITVDSFAQDAIYDSGRQKIKVYFTPDTISARDKNGQVSNVVLTNQNEAVYKMHVINVDFQKSADVEFRIDDLR